MAGKLYISTFNNGILVSYLVEACLARYVNDVVMCTLFRRASFVANVDNTDAVSNEVGPFATRYLRVHPTAYNSHIAMRLNVTACMYYAAGTYTMVHL